MAEMMMGEARTERRHSASVSARGPWYCASKTSALTAITALRRCTASHYPCIAGEIVGIAGVSGNGQREMVEVIAGQRRATAGRILVNNEIHLPERAMLKAHRFVTLPEEPLRNASVPRMTVAENMALRVFDQPPFQQAGFLLDRRAVNQFARDLIQRFSVRPPSPDVPIADLSGGNVQRVILARDFSSGEVQVLVAANPCFGLDFKATDFIHDALIEARNGGAAVLIVSEDLDELLDLADRILVISEGKLVHETTPVDADLNLIGRQMAGHH